MSRWFVVFALLLLIPAGSLFAQGFVVTWGYIPDDGGTALTTSCSGSTPIPDGRIVRIFWDTDSDGPDLTDPQPPLCENPPDCAGSTITTVNYDHFAMTGNADGYGPGFFWTDPGFFSVDALPSPPRYYLRIYDVDGTTVLWTSVVKTFAVGYQEVRLVRSDWVCGAGGPQCVVRDAHE
jgi:hypothetical protein